MGRILPCLPANCRRTDVRGRYNKKEEKIMMRRNMKRMMAAALADVMTASLALTGCGGKDKKSDSGEKVITVWSWDVALMQLQAAAEE